MIVSTLATSRPSEKLGTHSTSDIEGNRLQATAHREKSGSKRFFIYHIRHLLAIAAVVPLQHVDQALHAATGHSQFRVWGQTRLCGSAGKMMKQPATIFNFWIAEGRIGRERFFFKNI